MNKAKKVLLQYCLGAGFCLLAGNQRGATATKRVKHQRVCHAGVHDRICQKWDRLHGRMVTVFLRLIKFPDGGFLP